MSISGIEELQEEFQTCLVCWEDMEGNNGIGITIILTFYYYHYQYAPHKAVAEVSEIGHVWTTFGRPDVVQMSKK